MTQAQEFLNQAQAKIPSLEKLADKAKGRCARLQDEGKDNAAEDLSEKLHNFEGRLNAYKELVDSITNESDEQKQEELYNKQKANIRQSWSKVGYAENKLRNAIR